RAHCVRRRAPRRHEGERRLPAEPRARSVPQAVRREAYPGPHGVHAQGRETASKLMIPRRPLLFATAVLLVLGGCGRTRKPNVVLIVLDTLRGDRLSCMGYNRPTTPNIDALAAQGTLYTHAFSTCFWTLPSHAS